jgi:hypothetical protein
MKISLAIVTSRELSSFSFYVDALYAFESVLSKGLRGFNSDLVEKICIGLICCSPMFAKFFQPRRPKYYEYLVAYGRFPGISHGYGGPIYKGYGQLF